MTRRRKATPYVPVPIEWCIYCDGEFLVQRGDDRCQKCRREREGMVQTAAEQQVRSWERTKAARRMGAIDAEPVTSFRVATFKARRGVELGGGGEGGDR